MKVRMLVSGGGEYTLEPDTSYDLPEPIAKSLVEHGYAEKLPAIAEVEPLVPNVAPPHHRNDYEEFPTPKAKDSEPKPQAKPRPAAKPKPPTKPRRARSRSSSAKPKK